MIIKKLIALVVILPIALSIAGYSPSSYVAHPVEYSQTLGSGIEIDGLINATDELSKYQLYIVGETHAVVGTYSAKIELVRYFYEHHGVRTILMESGYCSEALLNQYLQNGDETILDYTMANLQGTLAYSVENKLYYQALYNYNQSLPEDERLKIYGVDIEHQYLTGLYYLQSLLPAQVAPIEIEEDIKSLYTVQNMQEAEKVLKSLNKSMEGHRSLYLKHLDSNYDEFVFAIDSINQGLTYYKNDDDVYREKCFTENLISGYEKAQGKCLALLGSWHTNMSGWNGERTVGQSLAEIYGVEEGGLASILFLYNNCARMNANGKEYRVQDEEASILARHSKANFTFFVLDQNDSQRKIRDLAKGQQYAILIQNSPATKIFQE